VILFSILYLDKSNANCEVPNKIMKRSVNKPKEDFEIVTETVVITSNYTTFEVLYPLMCRTVSSHFFLEINEESSLSLRRIPISCCEAKINSTEILSKDNQTFLLRLNDSTCGIHSRNIPTFQGKLNLT